MSRDQQIWQLDVEKLVGSGAEVLVWSRKGMEVRKWEEKVLLKY